MVKAQAGALLLELQEAHVEGRVVRHQHRLVGKGMEGRQHLLDGGLALHHLRLDAVDGNGRGGNRPTGVDQLLERLLLDQLAVEHPGGADLDDLIAFGRVEAGGLGVEHGVDQIDQATLFQILMAAAGSEQIEVVVLRSAVAVHIAGRTGGGHRRLGVGPGQQEAEEGLVAHPFALEPELAAVALHHVAHRQLAAVLATDLDAVDLPAHHRFGAHRLAGPDQVELGARTHRLQAQCELSDAVLRRQPVGQVGQRQQQRVTVHLEPDGLIHLVGHDTQVGQLFEAPARHGHQIGAEHFLQRPAGAHVLGAGL